MDTVARQSVPFQANNVLQHIRYRRIEGWRDLINAVLARSQTRLFFVSSRLAETRVAMDPIRRYNRARVEGTEAVIPSNAPNSSNGGPTMKVKGSMHKGVDWVSPDTPVTELAKLMRDHDVGAIPIGENDRLVGMVTDRDIVCKGLAQDNFDTRRNGTRCDDP